MRLDRINPFPSRQLLRVVIETPQASRNKYNYDPKIGGFVLKKRLPAGLHFPAAFGFIPQTRGADEDPLDAFVFFEDPLPVGCVVDCHLAGVLIVTQREGRRWVRNDRFLAIATESLAFGNVRSPSDFPATIIGQLKEFLRDYIRREGKQLKAIRVGDASSAKVLIAKQVVSGPAAV
jgi:inorganic pyrophosphatase